AGDAGSDKIPCKEISCEMTPCVDKQKAATEGNGESYNQQEAAQQAPSHVPPHEPAENQPQKHPAYGMPTWISILISGFIKREWRVWTDKCLVNTPGGRVRSFPPHAKYQTQFELQRALLA